MSILFSPLTIGRETFRNRLWVSPMCQYSATDGMPGEWHHVHLAQFASGGAGLVVAEATAVSPEGRISPEDVGIWNDAQQAAWEPIVAAIRSRGAAAGIQLAHAGRKASTWSPFAGSRGSVPLDRGGWATMAPSAVAFDGYATPAELDVTGIDHVVANFASAARRAAAAGFTVIEVHAAHGYLLHQFLSPLSNQRTDEYGGSFENRTRLLRRVVTAVKDAAPTAVIAVRLSATDWAEGGWDVDDTVRAAALVRAQGVELVDVSSGGLVAHQRITTGPGYQVAFAAAVRSGVDIAVNAVGMIDDAQLAEQVIARGDADAIMSGREWLRDPHFALRAASELGADVTWPAQYERARPR
jgi:2,4-dienoyl-CoA reductase-like NADH-dependent reductase (Old Yellow Enzyme family)